MAEMVLGKRADGGRAVMPLDAVTRAIAILGQRGTGKTNAAVVLVEEMVGAGGHVAVLDPVGAWWGVTHAGAKKGLKGIVIGGEHADVPLEETGGALVAELVASQPPEYRVIVIDMKLLRKGQQIRFMADFCETLFHLNRQALHVVFEEADRAAPQQPRTTDVNTMRLLGAVEDIVKLGRSRGLGITLVTQRPATLNKNVLEVCENLLLFRLMGPNDRKAARGWVEANGDEAGLRTVMESLASMGTGDCWLYSPAWLGVLERLQLRQRETFDSSSTPKVGEKVPEVTERAPVDLEQLTRLMAETVQRAKENDPKELRRELSIARENANLLRGQKERLEQEVASRPPADSWAELAALREDHAAVTAENGRLRGEVLLLRGALAYIRSQADEALTEVDDGTGAQGGAAVAAGDGGAEEPRPSGRRAGAGADSAAVGGGEAAGRRPDAGQGGRGAGEVPRSAGPGGMGAGEGRAGGLEGLKAGARRILTELAARYPATWTRPQLGALTRFSHRGGTFTTYLGELKRRGLVSEANGELQATDAGLHSLGGKPPAPTSHAEAMALWRRALKAGCFRMLEAVVEAGEKGITRADLAEAIEMTASGGTFTTYLGILRRNGLVAEKSGWGDGLTYVVATDVLWP